MSETPETPTIQPPPPEQADAAMRAGHYYVWLPGAEYDDLTSRLARAERIEAAAHETQALIYRSRCLLHDTQRLSNRHDPDLVRELIEQAERVLWEGWNAQNNALAEPVDDAGGGEE